MNSPETVSAEPLTRAERLAAAIAAHQASELDVALEGYRVLLRSDPGDPDALHFLGVLRFQLGDAEDAEVLMRASLEHAPHSAPAWNNLGNVLFATGRRDLAVEAYLRALEFNAEMAAPWRNLGECLEHAESPERAIAIFRDVIETVPGFVPAYDALGRILRIVGRYDEARVVYARWLELEPERPSAQHMLAAVSQESVPERAPDAYVCELFDRFASDFDEKLDRIGYSAPRLAHERVAALLGPPPAALVVLDAGCGTGLCGPWLRPYARHLRGVDLSRPMLEKAQERGAYDSLQQAELTADLLASADRYDLIVCVDTLCYFGALGGVLDAARHALRSSAHVVFTVEAWIDADDGDGYRLQAHGRYKHGRAYVTRMLARAGFVEVELMNCVLRQELKRDVAGWVVTARCSS